MNEIIALDMPLWEILLRGTLTYLAINVALRIIPKRHLGVHSPSDLIALVIVGGLATDAIGGGSESTLTFLLMAMVVFLWSYVFNVLDYKFPSLRSITQDSPTLVVHDGKLLRSNMRKEKLTEEELEADLREHGIEDLSAVKLAVVEVDGQLSVIQYDEADERS